MMNIMGIGTDMVSIARIRAIWDRFGLAFAQRILTPQEILELHRVREPAAFLAKRFAAKEAVAKALGLGFRERGILLTEIGVQNNALGKPSLYYLGKTAVEMARRVVRESHLSLADEREFALAFVILMV